MKNVGNGCDLGDGKEEREGMRGGGDLLSTCYDLGGDGR